MRGSLLLHGDLGARARVACRAEDVDQALPDFRHLELEELDQELGRGAAQEQLRTARLGAHVLEEGLDAVLRADRLARDHLVARDEALGVAAEVDEDAVAVDALDDARNQLTDAARVPLDDLRTLRLAHLLHDHLLGGLRGDAAERHRLERAFDVAARLGVGRQVEGVLQAQFLFRELELGRVVGEHLPAAERVVVAGLAVDGDAHVDFLAVFLACSRRKRRLERFEDDLLVDALLVRDGFHDHQDLLVHRSSSRSPGMPHCARCALRMPAIGSTRCRPSTSTSIVSAPTARQRALEPAPPVERLRDLDEHRRTDERREMPAVRSGVRSPATTPRACSARASGPPHRALRSRPGSPARSRRP